LLDAPTDQHSDQRTINKGMDEGFIF